MIHELKEEIYISLYLIIYGIYIISSYDILLSFFTKTKLNKVIKIIIELIFFIIQLILTYYFSYKLASGYMPIYFILFIVIGFVIYYKLLKESLLKNVEQIIKGIKQITPSILKIIQNLLYSKELIKIIKEIISLIYRRMIKIKSNKNDEVKTLENIN